MILLLAIGYIALSVFGLIGWSVAVSVSKRLDAHRRMLDDLPFDVQQIYAYTHRPTGAR